MKLLQMDFPYHGPGKDEMNKKHQDLARNIAGHPGVIWKLWAVNEETQEGGGIYLFEDEDSLNAYVKMHIERLKGHGVKTVNTKTFDIPETLTRITRGQLQRHSNKTFTTNKAKPKMRLLQMDFSVDGPCKDEMDKNYQDLAKSIAAYPGVIWKIWTVNEANKEGGGIYLFEDEDSLNAYVTMHTERLKSHGVTRVNTKIFKIPEILTGITFGPIPQ